MQGLARLSRGLSTLQVMTFSQNVDDSPGLSKMFDPIISS
eukprot:11378.XXX_693739_693855_1 [CDS] Oithona nana genome sequencing.